MLVEDRLQSMINIRFTQSETKRIVKIYNMKICFCEMVILYKYIPVDVEE